MHSCTLFSCFLLLGVAVSCETVTHESEDYTVPQGSSHSILDSKLERLRELTKEYPKRADYHYEIAAVYFQRSELNDSAAELERAIYLDPKQSKYHFHLGRVYLRMRELEKAEQAFRRTVELTPRDRYSGPHAALGYVLAMRGKPLEAVEQFREAIAIDPEVEEHYYFLGAIYDMKGDRENTIRYFREYLERGGVEYRKKTVFLLRRMGVEVDEKALPTKQETKRSSSEFDLSADEFLTPRFSND